MMETLGEKLNMVVKRMKDGGTIGATTMNVTEKSETLLNIWQTFQFKFDDIEKSISERADAARSLIFQLGNLCDR